MLLGASLETFTLIHVVISLIGIGTGLVAVAGMINNRLLKQWTAIFLVTTVLTSVTGFMFPFKGVTPGIILGAISLVVLLPTMLALFMFHLAGAWRWVYAAGAVMALYFNVFVLIVQSFQKVPALKALAPHQTEPPFVVTQGIVLVAFLVAGVMAVKRFHPAAIGRTRSTAAGS
jgi:hypothetical protein